MKLDLLYEFQPKIRPWNQPHPYGQREAEQRAYDEGIAEIQFADTLGFNTVWCVEHHFRDGRSACPSSEVVLGGLALSTKNLRLGFGVTLMPFGFIHPARVAEKVATVDILSHGRVEWGTGRSTPMEQTAFGVPTDDRSRDEWREAVEIVIAMWEQETFSYKSERFTMPERVVLPKPFQDPHPPVWMAGTSEPSARTAGRLGLGLLSFAQLRPLSDTAAYIAAYRDAQAQAHRDDQLTRVRTNKVAAYTLVHCVDDLDEAAAYGVWDSVEWWYRDLKEFAVKWELPNTPSEQLAQSGPARDRMLANSHSAAYYQSQDMIIIGTPEMCLEKLIRYDEAGVDELICYVQWGDLPHEKVMRSLELLGTKVIPQLEARGHRVNATALV
jgi:alkanesulfonate monooxygenase SsuD/methylene tetrahydromethanopterin reductase-like flavin-dependent oxidoreductase (luciferase family)